HRSRGAARQVRRQQRLRRGRRALRADGDRRSRVSAAMMGMLVRGLGADHVVLGTDAIWTGSPQWQIEALRRLEIPEDMEKQHGFKPLGAADGPLKTAILGGTKARLYKYERRAALANDPIARLKGEDEGA